MFDEKTVSETPNDTEATIVPDISEPAIEQAPEPIEIEMPSSITATPIGTNFQQCPVAAEYNIVAPMHHEDMTEEVTVAPEETAQVEETQSLEIEEPVTVWPQVTEEEQETINVMSQAGQAALASTEEAVKPFVLAEKPDALHWQKMVKSGFKKRVVKEENPFNDPNSFYNGGLLVLNVMAPRGYVFQGEDVFSVCDAQGLVLTEIGIFESYDAQGSVNFSVASAEDPGVFNPNALADQVTMGLTCFIELDMVTNPKMAFRKMLACAHELNYLLGGELLDDTGIYLSQQSVSKYLARIKHVETSREAMHV